MVTIYKEKRQNNNNQHGSKYKQTNTKQDKVQVQSAECR